MRRNIVYNLVKLRIWGNIIILLKYIPAILCEMSQDFTDMNA